MFDDLNKEMVKTVFNILSNSCSSRVYKRAICMSLNSLQLMRLKINPEQAQVSLQHLELLSCYVLYRVRPFYKKEDICWKRYIRKERPKEIVVAKRSFVKQSKTLTSGMQG